MAHAMAVHLALDTEKLVEQLIQQGLRSITVKSQAQDRASYLLRPDYGRRLSDASRRELQQLQSAPVDLLIVIGDGLSSLAIARHAAPLIAEIQQRLPVHWSLGPVVVATQARVALGDDVAETLKAKMVVILIGERPGLSSPDSLGIYFTYNPHRSCSDADRNCISNVRPEGLGYAAAAKKLIWLAEAAARIKLSGVGLKDESDKLEIDINSSIQIS
jgi:ethanolamine ammonia-lyase small subunit